MNDDILLKFLNKGLINVGGDDEKLGHLRQTAVDLTGILEETPAKASPFALVAFDPDVPPTDPTIVEVADALRKRWETYVNTFADTTPVAMFRAMLLDALIRACGHSDTVAAAFVASARNVLPFMEVGGEREIWADIVGEIERKVEERSEREWATPASISVPDIKFESPSAGEIQISSGKVNRPSLSKKLQAAAGPVSSAPDHQNNTGGNPHWPQDTSGQWVYEFGRRTAEAVDEAISQVIGGLSVEGVDLPGITENMMEVMSKHLTTTLQAVSNATAGLQRRTNLLWWKEALFSPSARMSYRDMTSFEAAALMAFDMHRQIPTFSPASVAAFLRETVIALPTIDQEGKAPIRELVEKTRDADVLSELRIEAGKLVSAPAGRGSVLAVIGHLDAVPQIEDRGFRDRVGVKPDTALTLPDWSVWMFRELQAARAIAEASAPKRRTSRKRTRRK